MDSMNNFSATKIQRGNNKSLVGVTVLLSALVTAPGVFAAASFGASATINMSGLVLEFPVVPTQPANGVSLFKSQRNDRPLERQASVTGSESALGQIASARSDGAASSAIGVLRAFVSGAADARSTADPISPFKVSTASVDSTLSAGWNDTATILGLPSGRLVTVHATLNYGGLLEESVNVTEGVNSAQASALVSVAGTGILVSTSGGIFERTSPATRNVTNPPKTVPISIVVQAGQPFALNYTLNVRGTITLAANLPAVTTSRDFRSLSEGTFKADFSHTVSWAGISSVTDANTGEILDNWSITSLSGFDYAAPAPVPLPASGLLLGASLLLLQRRRVTLRD